MTVSRFRVSINRITGTGDANGFIDPIKVEQYMAAEFGDDDADTYEKSKEKERANVRWDWVIQHVQSMGNLYVSDIDTGAADANTPPDVLTFTLTTDREEGMLITHDEENPGQELTLAPAIKRCIARALMQKRDTVMVDIYDPTKTRNPWDQEAPLLERVGSRSVAIKVDRLAADLTVANAAITVTKL